MRHWPVQDAKAKFSELLDRCVSEGPQVVTRRGAAAAVFVPMAQWTRMTETARPSLKDLLLGQGLRFDLDLPARGRWKRRRAKPLG